MTEEQHVVSLYVTVPTAEVAATIARALVEERLAACVNVLGPVRSIYRWQGAVHDDPEVAFLAKTRAALVEAATARIKSLHPYECPCIVALPVVGGHPAFLDWVRTET